MEDLVLLVFHFVNDGDVGESNEKHEVKSAFVEKEPHEFVQLHIRNVGSNSSYGVEDVDELEIVPNLEEEANYFY